MKIDNEIIKIEVEIDWMALAVVVALLAARAADFAIEQTAKAYKILKPRAKAFAIAKYPIVKKAVVNLPDTLCDNGILVCRKFGLVEASDRILEHITSKIFRQF